MKTVYNPFDEEYLRVLGELLHLHEQRPDEIKKDRTGVGTISMIGVQTRYDMTYGIPVLTTKKINYKAVVVELLWFLNTHTSQEPYRKLDVTNIKYLVDNNVGIWTDWCYDNYLKKQSKPKPETQAEWKEGIREFTEKVKSDYNFADRWGNIGDGIYTKQWRNFDGIDQIAEVINQLRTNPDSRRIRVSAWNPKFIPSTLLPPCHTDFQFITQNNGNERELSLIFNMRSNDYFLGNPFNIASYATLLQIVSELVDMKPKMVICNAGDCHLYLNHVNPAWVQIDRFSYEPPKLVIKGLTDINTLTHEQFELVGYQHHPFIYAPVAV